MHVIGHQYIGVQRAICFLQRFAEPMEVALVVLLREKARLAIVAPLDDVEGNAIEVDAGAAGHGAGMLPNILSLAPFMLLCLAPFMLLLCFFVRMLAWPLL